ncbi:MAG: hypothetical protein HY774_27370 [Acidobacteria bacterium]|nr:hypothetical protein [Acidobacteriota bacterium]
MQSVSAQEPKNLIVLRSENRHYVGEGQYQEYSDGVFESQVIDNDQDQGIEYLRIHYSDPRNSAIGWGFTFHMKTPGKNLTPGVYSIPVNEDPQPPGSSFLIGGNGTVLGSGKGCGFNSGNFTIFELEVDYKQSPPQLVKFAASFEQHCGGGRSCFVRVGFVSIHLPHVLCDSESYFGFDHIRSVCSTQSSG